MSEQTEQRNTLSINWLQVVAGALAAVTSAVLIAGLKSLGAYGTLVGAVVGSAAASIGAAIYNHYLTLSRQRLYAVAQRARRRRPGDPLPVPVRGDDTDRIGPLTEQEAALEEVSEVLTPARPRRRWLQAAVVGVLALVVSVGALAVYEYASGEPVTVQRQGQTVTASNDRGIFGQTVTPASSSPTDTATSTDTATGSPTATATDTATASATDSATDSATPSATGTDSSTASGDATASSSASSSAKSSATASSTRSPSVGSTSSDSASASSSSSASSAASDEAGGGQAGDGAAALGTAAATLDGSAGDAAPDAGAQAGSAPTTAP